MAARNVWTYVFLRLRRWLLKQQPNKTVFNRFIENLSLIHIFHAQPSIRIVDLIIKDFPEKHKPGMQKYNIPGLFGLRHADVLPAYGNYLYVKIHHHFLRHGIQRVDEIRGVIGVFRDDLASVPFHRSDDVRLIVAGLCPVADRRHQNILRKVQMCIRDRSVSAMMRFMLSPFFFMRWPLSAPDASAPGICRSIF